MTTALDLFRGAGGWSVAAQRLGITDYGIEYMREANETATAAGHKSIQDDVWDGVPEGIFNGEIASPPCQTFSAAGKGAGRKALDTVLAAIRGGAWQSIDRLRSLGEAVGDERTALVLTPLAYAYKMRPEWIAWEQVPTVLPVWEACAEELRALGYSTWTGNLQAEQYGVPQTRKRAILIASRTHIVGMPKPTHSRYYPRDPARLDEGVRPWVSMAEALGRDAEGITLQSNYSTGGDVSTRGERTLDEPASTVTSKSMRWLQVNARANATIRSINEPAPTLTSGHSSAEMRWLPEWCFRRPSTTIVGSFKPEVVAAPGYRTTVSRQNAPDSVRVTVQEAGILQSFPADYPWQGSKTKQYLQVGNAIPPFMAEAILREACNMTQESAA